MRIKFFLFLVIIAAGFLIWKFLPLNSQIAKDAESARTTPVITDRLVQLEITPNSTYGILMSEAEIEPPTSQAIFEAAETVYDLSNIRLGRTLNLFFDPDQDELKQLVYQIDSEAELYVTKTKTTMVSLDAEGRRATTTQAIWQAERKPIAYEVKIKTASGIIETSMYQAALDNSIDERAIIEVANAFQWSVDFALDPRVGDTFKFIYQERYLDGKYIMPGQILAGKYINDGAPYYVFYFKESDDNEGYFDQDGNSVQKIFLKAPVAYKYITSGYTTGARYIQAFNISTGHHANPGRR